MTIDVKPADFDIEALAPGEAVAVDWSESEYFSDRRALTRSVLKNLDEENGDPRKFRDWLAGEDVGKSSRSMSFGVIVHLAILEPEVFFARVRIKGGHVDASKFGFVRGRFIGEEHADPIYIDADEHARLIGVYGSILHHRSARRLLADPDGRSELTVAWRHPGTGLLVKVRVDRLVRMPDTRETERLGLSPGWAVPDIKTSRDPSPRPFLRTARYDYGYVEQDAMYTDALEAWLGEPVSFYFVASRNQPDYETAVYNLGAGEIDFGRRRYTRRLESALERSISNEWRPDWARGVQTIGYE